MAEAISTYTIRALKEALRWLSPKQSVLIRGRHGIGKSAVAYQMAEDWNLPIVVERRISQLSEGDMIGLPDRGAKIKYDGKEHDVTRFLPTDWFLQAEYMPVLVFLDEINRGTPEVQQACFQFIEKGELNGRKIHPESRIIAAVNYSKEYQVTPMDQAFLDRFWIADLEPDKTDWLDWAAKPIDQKGGGISTEVIDFIRQCNEDHFEIKPEKLAQLGAYEIAPSRRSWERLDRHITRTMDGHCLLEQANSNVFYNVCRGFVGPDASRALSKFLVDNHQNVTPEDVLNKFDSVKGRVIKLKPETQVALVDKVKHFMASQKVKLTDDQGKNMAAFMRSLPAEIGIQVWNNVAATDDVPNATCLHKHVGKYIIDMLSQTKIGAQLPQLKDKK